VLIILRPGTGASSRQRFPLIPALGLGRTLIDADAERPGNTAINHQDLLSIVGVLALSRPLVPLVWVRPRCERYHVRRFIGVAYDRGQWIVRA